jgi:hypothetical protein
MDTRFYGFKMIIHLEEINHQKIRNGGWIKESGSVVLPGKGKEIIIGRV